MLDNFRYAQRVECGRRPARHVVRAQVERQARHERQPPVEIEVGLHARNVDQAIARPTLRHRLAGDARIEQHRASHQIELRRERPRQRQLDPTQPQGPRSVDIAIVPISKHNALRPRSGLVRQ